MDPEEIHGRLLDISRDPYPSLCEAMKGNGVIELSAGRDDELFTCLARTVVGQQLSAPAARTIWSNLETAAFTSNMDVNELFFERNHDMTHRCGVSRNKIKTINRLMTEIQTGGLTAGSLKNSTHASVREKISSLWGFGEWSADMCSIFYCGFPDVFPDSDAAINRVMKSVITDSKPVSYHASRFSPYRSYVCVHIWRAADRGLLPSAQ